MGCAASKLDIETADQTILSGLRPINLKKHRRRRLRSDLIQSDVGSETAGDTSPSGKARVSVVAPEPIAEEEPENSDQEALMMAEEKKDVLKEVSEEKKQKWQEMTKNGEQPEQIIEERSHCPIAEKIKENNEEKNGDAQVNKSSRNTEELAKDSEEPPTKEEKEEIDKKNKLEAMEKAKAGYNGPKLVSKRIEELEEDFPGSPSFRFYCQNVPSFDPDDSITAPVLRSTERLEEIKQQNEPIEEVSESQASVSTSISISASSQGSQCHSPRKRRGRRMLKLKAPNSVRTLFTCYSSSNGCGNSSPGSIHYKKHLISKPK